MTRNEFKTEAKLAIIDKLEEGYEGYLCDLHNNVENMIGVLTVLVVVYFVVVVIQWVQEDFLQKKSQED